MIYLLWWPNGHLRRHMSSELGTNLAARCVTYNICQVVYCTCILQFFTKCFYYRLNNNWGESSVGSTVFKVRYSRYMDVTIHSGHPIFNYDIAGKNNALMSKRLRTQLFWSGWHKTKQATLENLQNRHYQLGTSSVRWGEQTLHFKRTPINFLPGCNKSLIDSFITPRSKHRTSDN